MVFCLCLVGVKLTKMNSTTRASRISWLSVGGVFTGVLTLWMSHDGLLALTVATAEIAVQYIVQKILDKTEKSAAQNQEKPAVIWLTGLSGSGKTTIANELILALRERGQKVEALDGDTIRQALPQTGFSRADRDTHIRRAGYLASRLEAHGVSVVASFISPYQDSREFVRRLCQNFVEIHVATPLEICESRDPKGLYKKVRAGEIKNFTGIDDPH